MSRIIQYFSRYMYQNLRKTLFAQNKNNRYSTRQLHNLFHFCDFQCDITVWKTKLWNKWKEQWVLYYFYNLLSFLWTNSWFHFDAFSSQLSKRPTLRCFTKPKTKYLTISVSLNKVFYINIYQKSIS